MPKSNRDSSKSIIPGSGLPYIRTTKNSNKEWEKVKCPICLETPHGAVLLICSSHDKGCRTYMCNAPIQSHCLEKFRDMKFPCPLCRGRIIDEQIVERARQYLDLKVKGCKVENCEFSGTRRELTAHWWVSHERDRLVEAEKDRMRQSEWARSEQESELQDMVQSDTSANVIDANTNAVPSVTSASGASVPVQPRINRTARMSVAGSLRFYNL